MEHGGPVDWICARCSERVEADFDRCWNCGHDRTEAAPAPPLPPPIPELEPEPFEPPPPPSRWRGPGRAILAFLGWIAAQFLGAFGITILLISFGVESIEDLTWLLYLVSAVCGLAGAYVATRTLFGGRPVRGIPSALGWAPSSAAAAGGGFAIGVLLAVGYRLLTLVVPVGADHEPGPMVELANSSWLGFCTWVTVVVVLAPPAEELLFRGAMLHGFMQRFGAVFSVVVVTVLFTALHVVEIGAYWPAWVAIGGLGVLAAVLRLRSRSLVPPLLAHFGYNAAIVVGALV